MLASFVVGDVEKYLTNFCGVETATVFSPFVDPSVFEQCKGEGDFDIYIIYVKPPIDKSKIQSVFTALNYLGQLYDFKYTFAKGDEEGWFVRIHFIHNTKTMKSLWSGATFTKEHK